MKKRTKPFIRSLSTTRNNTRSGRLIARTLLAGGTQAKVDRSLNAWPTSKKSGPTCDPSACANRWRRPQDKSKRTNDHQFPAFDEGKICEYRKGLQPDCFPLSRFITTSILLAHEVRP